MKRSIVTISLLLMISVATPAQVAIDLKIEKQLIDNNQYVKVMLKNISDYNLSIWTDCDGVHAGYFISDPSSSFIIRGNPNMPDSISTEKIVFPGTLNDFGSCIKRRVLVMSGETYTGLFPIWGGNYTRKDGLLLDRKNNIKEIQVKVMARYYDIHASKVVHVEVLSNVLKL